ncbi:hypothetical protein [Kitasatospora sp. NPDC087314]|uniref:hypothetical protein n=1 Tax=Kitasatospora sp. NPDC087314 TaxID=3364068 RepID=UPI003806E330
MTDGRPMPDDGRTPDGDHAPAVTTPAVNTPAVNTPVVNVAAYWGGDFTLRPAPPEPADDPDEPSPHRLGRSGVTVRGRDLAALLAPAYEAFRS